MAGLGDLLNLDYGYGLRGDSPSIVDMLRSPPDYGEMAYSLDVPGIDDAAMRPPVIDVSPSGAQPLGWRGEGGGLENLQGQPIAYDPFNIRTGISDDPFGFKQGISAPMSASKVLQDAARLGGVGGGRDGGGGGIGISAPSISSPAAATIPRITPAPVPQSQAPVPFNPMAAATDLSAAMKLAAGGGKGEVAEPNYLPAARRREMMAGLARLFQEGQ